MSEKAIRSELKQPDSFQRVGGEARDWMVDHQRLLAGAVVAVLVIGAGASIAHYLSERREARAARALGEALEPVNRRVEGEVGEPSLPSAKPAFKSAAEKDKAIVASLSAFRSTHAKGPSAATAALALAQAQFRLGDHSAALASFDAFLKDAPSGDPLRAAALEGRGYALEALSRNDEALAAYDALTQESAGAGGLLSGMGLYHRGRLLEKTGRKEEAIKLFNQASTEAPGSAAARMSKERLALLSSR